MKISSCSAALLLACSLSVVTAPAVQARANDAGITAAQLEQLVAPIALYPDTLLTQILMASTYPLEVVGFLARSGAALMS